MIRLPKTEDVSEVEIVAKKIEEVEKANGWEEGTINIIVAIESVRGLYNVREICHGPRVVAIALGAEDYRADLRTGKSNQLLNCCSLVKQSFMQHAKQVSA